jgi:hypothetical protein
MQQADEPALKDSSNGGKSINMTKTVKRLITVMSALACIALTGVFVVSSALAQDPTPTPPPGETTEPKLERGFKFGFGGSSAQFDAVAAALKLTPTQLFEQLHSGKTLQEIATAQGVDLQVVQDALKTSRMQVVKDAIAQAVKDGRITQEQADWMLQGIEKGFMPMGRGFGFGGRHGRGFGKWEGPQQTPATPTPTPGSTT